MRQVLLWIPLRDWSALHWLPSWVPERIPIYGYGMMLFLAFLVTSWFAARRARKEGIAPQHLQDLAIWLFVSGIAGARLTYMIQYGVPIWRFFQIWQGGLVFYGATIGGALGFFAAYFLIVRRHRLSVLKLADIIAPCVAIGLALGRVGCLLNGCCWGNVATCDGCPHIEFPLSAPARYSLVERGYQTSAGFLLRPDRQAAVVDRVADPSPAASAGVEPGDTILAANDLHGASADAPLNANTFRRYLVEDWPRGQTSLQLTVRHPDGKVASLAAFRPETRALHPTQIYESVTALLLFALLLAYLPFRRHDGELMALLMCIYPIHRFLDEMLRNDTDPVWGTGMTLSQNLSIVCIVGGLILLWWLRRQPAQYDAPSPVKMPALASGSR